MFLYNFLCQMCWLHTIFCFPDNFPRQLSVLNVLVTDYLLFPSVSQTTFCVKCFGYRLFAISICFPDNFLCQMSWLQTICCVQTVCRANCLGVWLAAAPARLQHVAVSGHRTLLRANEECSPRNPDTHISPDDFSPGSC